MTNAGVSLLWVVLQAQTNTTTQWGTSNIALGWRVETEQGGSMSSKIMIIYAGNIGRLFLYFFHSHKFHKTTQRWLGLRRSLTSATLYGTNTILQLPFSGLTEKYKKEALQYSQGVISWHWSEDREKVKGREGSGVRRIMTNVEETGGGVAWNISKSRFLAWTLDFVCSRVGSGCPITIRIKGECNFTLMINPQNAVRFAASLKWSRRSNGKMKAWCTVNSFFRKTMAGTAAEERFVCKYIFSNNHVENSKICWKVKNMVEFRTLMSKNIWGCSLAPS